MSISHADLIAAAHGWLLGSQRHDCVVSESAAAFTEIPDVIGWKNSFSTLVECKVSRADFLADQQKPFRKHPERGMGYERWYFVPKGLLAPTECPIGWGLVELRGTRVFKLRKPVPFIERNVRLEMEMLVDALRRVQRDYGHRIFAPVPEFPIVVDQEGVGLLQ